MLFIISQLTVKQVQLSLTNILNKHIRLLVLLWVILTPVLLSASTQEQMSKSIDEFNAQKGKKEYSFDAGLQVGAGYYIGDANSNVAPDYDGWVDLFCWGTGANPINVSNDYNDYQIFTDWGRNEIEGNMMSTWHTLTSDEWTYLLDCRKNAKNLKGIAQVNGVNGLIILPDNWKTPKGIIFKPRFHHEQSIEAYRQYQTLTAEQWSILEQSGAVFLPAAVSRIGNVVDSTSIYGHYWTSTINDDFSSYHFYLYSNEAGVGCCSPYVGMSVRLVKDL